MIGRWFNRNVGPEGCACLIVLLIILAFFGVCLLVGIGLGHLLVALGA